MKVLAQVIYCLKYESWLVVYTTSTCMYLTVINWKPLGTLIVGAYVLRYRFDDMIQKYPKIVWVPFDMFFSCVDICIHKAGYLIILHIHMDT